MAKKTSKSPKAIKITKRTNMEQFQVGQRVELTFVPLDQYTWKDGESTPALCVHDIEAILRSHDTGIIVELIDDDDDPGFLFCSDLTGQTYDWRRGNLQTVKVIGQGGVLEVPARFTIDDTYESHSFRYKPGTGIQWLCDDDADDDDNFWSLVKWDLIRVLAAMLGMVPWTDDISAIELFYSISIERESHMARTVVKVGCKRASIQDVRKFLTWALERCPNNEEASP